MQNEIPNLSEECGKRPMAGACGGDFVQASRRRNGLSHAQLVDADLTDECGKRLLTVAGGCDVVQASRPRNGLGHAKFVGMNLSAGCGRRSHAGEGAGDFVQVSRPRNGTESCERLCRSDTDQKWQGQIFVKGQIPLRGDLKTRTVCVEAQATDTISQLLNEFFPPVWNIRVLWRGKLFRGDCTLAECKINRGCTNVWP